MPQPNSANTPAKSDAKAVTKMDYLALATFLEGRRSVQRIHKKESYGAVLRAAAEFYGKREYVLAYESFNPVCDRVVGEMQRVLARNFEFEANKLAKEQQTPLAAAKESVQKMRAYAQQVIDQFDRLRQDLENKPLVRIHLKKRGSEVAVAAPPVEVAPPTALSSANETQVDTNSLPPTELVSGASRYHKAPYCPPEKGALYSVRDKVKGERIIRVIGKSPDGELIQVEVLKEGIPSKHPIQLTVDSLARQAEMGWCSLLLPISEKDEASAAPSGPSASDDNANAIMRLDIQNFGRCCADIARANIKFDTQLIKDVGDGPFRAGQYEQAFLTFEQFALGFNSAVTNSRRAIADGRRALNAEKGNLSGKEIQERTAAFIRNEQLIQTAEREFSRILEGLRTYLRARTEPPATSTS